MQCAKSVLRVFLFTKRSYKEKEGDFSHQACHFINKYVIKM